MGKRYEIKVGDKVDLCLEDQHFYRVIVQEQKEDNILYVSMPTYKSIIVNLRAEQQLKLFYYRETGRYFVETQVTRVGKIGNVPVAEIKILSQPYKEQRRHAYRVPANIKTIVCFADDYDGKLPPAAPSDEDEGVNKEIAYTKDISETGVAVVMKKPCGLNKKIILELYLPTQREKEPPLMIMSEVRREIYDEVRKTYLIGLQFLEVNKKTSAILAKYTIERQKQIITQERLVEGD